MEISFLGLSCFLIKTLGGKGKEIELLIDPFFEDFKKPPSPLGADILLLSQKKTASQIKGSPFLIQRPGEYEIEDVFIQGIEAGENTLYLIELERITLCHLNSFAKRELNSDLLEKMGNIDILMIPVGGALGPEGAAGIVSQIEPKIVIPMEYQIPNLKTKRGKLKDFLKVLGIEKAEALKKLKIKKKKLPEETKVLVLEEK